MMEIQDLSEVKMVLFYTDRKGKLVSQEIPASEFGYSEGEGLYTVLYSDIAPANMRSEVSAVICRGDVPISSTVVYGIETYAYKRMESSQPSSITVQPLMESMMKYSDRCV